MGVVTPSRAVEFVSRAKDAKRAILDFIGDYSSIDVMFNMVLVATHIRSNTTSGGIIRPDMNVEEDVWQGKAGLVLSLGPNAFVDDSDDSFYGQKVSVGEWCVFKVGDGWALNVKGYPCRLVRDSSIKLKVKDPNIIL